MFRVAVRPIEGRVCETCERPIWTIASTRRNQKTGGNTSGIGGPNDPMAQAA